VLISSRQICGGLTGKQRIFIMSLPKFTIRQMIENGVHFGHHARRWNPKMAGYIYGKKDNIHIIDLQQTYPMLYKALNAAREIAAQGGKILFIGTKRQAQDIIKENAERCGQYYVNYRWLGGMMTNWKTVHKSISRLVKLNDMFENNTTEGYTKKELLNLKKEQEKLSKELNGVMNMGGQPDLLFVVDMPKEDLAIKEAKKLGIPVIGIADTNADPELADFPIPGNDDAIRAIQFYCELVSSAVLDGIQAEIAAQGVKVDEIVADDAKSAKKKAKTKEATEETVEAKKETKAKVAKIAKATAE
jgi:small subunit ribosomal protein S2